MAYLDESYTADRFFLGALLVDDACALSLSAALEEVVRVATVSYGVVASAELHGYPLFHGVEQWKPMKSQPRARATVYRRALRAVAEHGGIVVIRGVDRHELERCPDDRPVHDVALQHLLEHLDDFGAEVDEPVLVIADEVHESDRLRHRVSLREFRELGTPGERSSRLEWIVDTLHYAPSEQSRFLQAIDLVTFLHQRRVCVASPDPRAARVNEVLWEQIAGCVRHMGDWP